MKSFGTKEAAKKIGVTRVTLQRWLARGLIRPSIAIPMAGRIFRNWTLGDIRRAKELKATLKSGPKRNTTQNPAKRK